MKFPHCIKQFRDIGLLLCLFCLSAIPTQAETSGSRWRLLDGGDRPLCIELLKVARTDTTLDASKANIPWRKILAIKGISEPSWTALNPAEHEELFLKAREFMQLKVDAPHLGIMSFERWFKPLNDRLAKSADYRLSDEEALRTYRSFVGRGGKLKTLRYNDSNDGPPYTLNIFQYEMPGRSINDWDGVSLQMALEQSSLSVDSFFITYTGLSHRILSYKGTLFSFRAEHLGFRIQQLSGEPLEINDHNFCLLKWKIVEPKREGEKE